MRIVEVAITPVNIPLEAPIRWAWGVRTGVTRNVVQIRTDDGLEGLGETMGGDAIGSLARKLGASMIGADPFALETILARFQLTGYFQGYGGLAAIGGLEMALWDLMGKGTARPVCDLLGGRFRDEVAFSAYVFYRYADGPTGGETSPEEIVDYCQRWRERAGFRVWKLKAGVFSPRHDLEVLRAMRRALGDDAELRVDPNAVWTPQTTLRMRPEFEAIGLEYLEDPTWGLDNMATLRRDIPIPFATNMCVVDFDQIPLAVRLRAVDVVLGDAHKWGGLAAVKKLAAICEAFGLGLSLHSGVELGISTAANLHLAASTPHLRYAVDSHALHQADDIVEGGPPRFRNGGLPVPTAPGLGVALDPDRFARAVELHKRQGDLGSVGDPRRPDFVPAKQLA
jgi:glucarate dehydratase